MARKEKEKESRRNMHRPFDEAGEEEDAEYEAGDEPENEEVGTFEMNGVTMNSEPHDCGEWTKFNLDTGAAQTAIPKSWNAIQWTPGTTVTFQGSIR